MAKLSYHFLVAVSLIHNSSCSVYGILGEGLAENVRIPSYGGKGV